MRWIASSRRWAHHMCLLFVSLCLLVPHVTCSTIAAWLTAPHPGPHFVLQDLKTGDITHNFCNSNGTPVYPIDTPPKLPLKSLAKNPSSLAAAGWWGGSQYGDTVWASIFYQSNNNELVNAVYQCNMSSGTYNMIKSTDLNNGLIPGMPQVAQDTGLAVDLLGATAGYALFFHDTNGSVHYLRYTEDLGWKYAGKMSPDQALSGKAIGTAFFSNTNMTVVMPKDDSNIEVAMYKADDTWGITTFPSPLYDTSYSSQSINKTNPLIDTFATKTSKPLKAWTGNPKAVGLATDFSLRRYLFYIGSDSNLHLVTSTLTNGVPMPWDLATDYEANYWPKAKEPGAEFALTSNPQSYDVILIYRDDKDTLRMLNQSSAFGSWSDAIAVPTERPPPPPVPNNTTVPADTESNSLSNGQQAGIGVGAAVGALLIGTLGVAAFVLRRRRRRTDEAARAAAAHDVNHDVFGHPDSCQYQQHQQQWQHQPAMETGPIPWEDHKKEPVMGEMASSPLPRPPSELPSQFQVSHELAGDGRASPVSQHVVYIPSAGQVLDSNGYGAPGPSSPQPSNRSSHGGHMSPAPAYVARESGAGFDNILEEAGTYGQHDRYSGYHSPVASPPPQHQQLQQGQQQMGGQYGMDMMPDVTYMHQNGSQLEQQNPTGGGYYTDGGDGQHYDGQNAHHSTQYVGGDHDGGQYSQSEGPVGQAYGATGASPVDVRGSGMHQGAPPGGQDEMFMYRTPQGQ